MVTSGWRIYNASPLYDFSFPKGITLGGWLGGALQWHFAAMWLLAINGLVYLIINLVQRSSSRRFFPVSPKGVLQDLWAALRGKLGHADLSHYNQVQRLAYLFVMLDITLWWSPGWCCGSPCSFRCCVNCWVATKARGMCISRDGAVGGICRGASGDGRARAENAVGHDRRSQGAGMKKRIEKGWTSHRS